MCVFFVFVCESIYLKRDVEYDSSAQGKTIFVREKSGNFKWVNWWKPSTKHIWFAGFVQWGKIRGKKENSRKVRENQGETGKIRELFPWTGEICVF